ITALFFAAQYPGIAKAILLEDPPAFWMPASDTAESRAQRAVGLREFLVQSKSKTLEELLEESQAQIAHWSETEQRYWAESKHHASPHIATWFNPDDNSNPDWASVLAK